jgi:autotransporter-associated beta strand protein
MEIYSKPAPGKSGDTFSGSGIDYGVRKRGLFSGSIVCKFLAVIILLAAFHPASYSQVDRTWQGLGLLNTWNVPQNWIGGVVPASGDGLIFAGSNWLTNRNNFTGYTFRLITFTNSAGAFTLSGNEFTLTGSFTNNSPNIERIYNPITLSGQRIFNAAAGIIVLSGRIAGTDAGITKTGNSIVVLTNSTNTYTGPTRVNAGNFRLNPSTSPSSFASKITLNFGTLSTTNIIASTVITSSSTLNVTANSTIALGGNVHSLIFANSSSEAWTGSVLTITGWVGTPGSSGTAGKIFFGNDATGLTQAQLDMIVFTGYSAGAQILATGEIVPKLPQIVISSADPAVPDGNINESSVNNVIYNFGITVSNKKATITGLQVTTGGTYSASDLSNLKAWFSTDNIFDPALDPLLSTKSTSLGPGTQIFPSWINQDIASGTTGYIFLTADVACENAPANTVFVNAVTTSDVSFFEGNKSGSTLAGGTQTILLSTPVNATNFSASQESAQSALIWTNPAGCYDELMIVGKSGSAVTMVPTGDGSAYTASLSFGAGTGFDGGFIVYKGTVSGQTVTGLINGTTYYFTLFTRRGTNWSSGITTSVTPGSVAGDYRSAANGSWGSLTTWERYDGASWVTPTAVEGTPNTSSGVILIRDGHIVTVGSPVSVDQVIVETGGKLTVNNVTLTVADGTGSDLVINGNVELTGNSGIIAPTGTILFNSGSKYIHNRNAGTIPVSTWDVASTCEITGITNGGPVGLSQNFGNFTWNCTSQTSNINFSSTLAGVQGTFTLASTGSAGNFINPGGSPVYQNFVQTGGAYLLRTGTSPRNVSVVHNFSISGGTYTMNNGAFSASLTIGGDFLMTGGTIEMNSGSGTGTLRVAGNFTHSSGTITESSTGGTILFNGTAQQLYTSGGTISNVINFSVSSGAWLQMAAPGTVITGSGSFTLMAGGTLGITSAGGISSSGATGNIRVGGSRNFSTDADYIYNGLTAQVTGTGLPANVSNLTFDNAGGNVTFSSVCTITNLFAITTGSRANLSTYVHTAGSLTLGGIVQRSGTYGSTASSANHKNDTYFSVAGTGIVRVTSGCAVGTWNGADGTRWNDPANWCGEVLPTASTDVVISPSPNQPVISGLPTAVCNSLTIETGAILTINPGMSLTVGDKVSNSGTLNLNSDATGSASLILNSYSGTGNMNVQIYLTGGPASIKGYTWHYISSPVESLSTGIFTGWTRDLLRYVESLAVSAQPHSTMRGWIGYDNFSYFYNRDGGSPSYAFSTLTPGMGYNYYSPTTNTFTFRGTPNTGDMGVPISYTGTMADILFSGYNLLGNPFTCGINWDAVTSTESYPIDASTMVYFTHDNQSYTYQEGVGVPASVTGHIPPMQGFVIKTTGSGTLTIPQSAREHYAIQSYKAETPPISLIRLALTEKEKLFETVVRFDNKARPDFDLRFDAPRIFAPSGIGSIYTISGGMEFTINGQPFPENSVTIPVIVSLAATGVHKITATELNELNNYNVFLTDNVTNTTIDLKNARELSFSSAAGVYKTRFVLTISAATKGITGIAETIASEKPFNIYSIYKFINVQTLAEIWDGRTGSVRVLDLAGKTTGILEHVEFRKGSLIQLPSPVQSGFYLVEIRSGKMSYSGRIVAK